MNAFVEVLWENIKKLQEMQIKISNYTFNEHFLSGYQNVDLLMFSTVQLLMSGDF